jgi:hypothetical protein
MDNDTIIKLMNKQEGNLKEFIQVSMSLNRAKIINELDPLREDVSEIRNVILPKISEDNDIRNHRIQKLEDCKSDMVDCVEVKNQTAIVRWLHRNPGWTAILFMALILGITALTQVIDVGRTVEEATPIELRGVE